MKRKHPSNKYERRLLSDKNKSGLRRNSKMETRTIETSISGNNLKDQTVQFLYAVGMLNDDEEVTDLKIGNILLNNGTVPIKITFKKLVKQESVPSEEVTENS